MLLPALSKARERARQTACLNNLKQWAITIRMYLEDYDGYFPPSYVTFWGWTDASPIYIFRDIILGSKKFNSMITCPTKRQWAYG
ncbi:MAG: DUF1559 domain-containing protein [Candidatus Omnitrophica bacterium]|nr:DUF1559 domain-containing protein [Candidatus Omnitrophota bacterium]